MDVSLLGLAEKRASDFLYSGAGLFLPEAGGGRCAVFLCGGLFPRVANRLRRFLPEAMVLNPFRVWGVVDYLGTT